MGNHTGAPLPFESGKRWWKIRAPRGEEKLTAVLLSDGFVGCWSHWVGRTVPCSETPECEFCRAHQPMRWTGYMPAVVRELSAWVQYVLALTEGAARYLCRVEEQWSGLRGLNVTFQRKATKNDGGIKVNDPVMVKVHHKEDLDKIPAPFDVVGSVTRLYGHNEWWALHMRNNGAARKRQWQGEGPEKGAIGEPIPA